MRAFRIDGRPAAPRVFALPRHVAGPLAVLAITVVAAGCGSTSASTPKTAAGSATPSSANLLGAAYDTSTPAQVTLNGAGANSIEPFFETVFYQYNQKNPNTTVNYSPAGSSVGVTDIQQGTVAFGDSEIPMTASQLAAATGGTVLQIPVDLGGVAISYNVPGVTKSIDLDGPTLAGIFDGSITNWDDPAIAALNPGVTPAQPGDQGPVHRADSSGPGYDLDQYLIDTAPAWVTAIGTSTPSRTWPEASVGDRRAAQHRRRHLHQPDQRIDRLRGVRLRTSESASSTPPSRTRPDRSWPPPRRRSPPRVPRPPASAPPTSTWSTRPGSGTYPIANFSWTLVYQKQTDTNTGIALGKLFDWVITSGQEDAASLGYAPLPSNVVTLAHNTILELESSTGTPLFSNGA